MLYDVYFSITADIVVISCNLTKQLLKFDLKIHEGI